MDFEGIDHLIQPEIITPAQWKAMNSGRQLNGEHKLMLAILLNGIREYQMKPYRTVTSKHKLKDGTLKTKTTQHENRIAVDAREWVTAHEEGIFAFDTLCEEFNLDANGIRAKLTEYNLKGKRIRVVQPPVIEKGVIGQTRSHSHRSERPSPCLKDPAYVERQRRLARERYRERYRESTREKRIALRAELDAIKEARA